MKTLSIIFMVCLPLSLVAQQTTSNLATDRLGSTNSAPTPISLAEGASYTSSQDSAVPSTSNQTPTVPEPKKQKSTQAKEKKPPETSNPPIEGSMVGYVDNAIVGSQVRIRFDAGFHDNVPDRAEFFYAQCGCNGGKATGPSPGSSDDINFQQLYVQVEYAPIRRLSVFAEVPVRWIQPQAFLPNTGGTFPNQSGISDVRAGFKLSLHKSDNHIFTFQLRNYFASGDSFRGLGTGHYSIEPSLLYYQKLSSRWALESQLGDWHPVGGSTLGTKNYAGDVFFYGIGPSYQLLQTSSIRLAPVVELVGWSVLGGLQTIAPRPGTAGPVNNVDASGTNIVNLKMGVRTVIHSRSSFYIGYGRALTSARWYSDLLRVEYRFSF